MNFDALQANNGYLDSQSSLIDPSMFNANNIDLNAFQNPQLQQQRLQNGNVRNASPAAFQNPAYNVNPIVPSKRPRPSEDAPSASPRPAPGSMSLSRSQTPQQMSFAPGAFQTNQHQGQGLQAPNPYQHLQHQGSSNATPSPTMQSQQFRPPQQAHRMNTIRVNTPQNPAMAQMAAMNMNNMNMMQGSPTGQGFNQNFGMNPGMSAAGFNGTMPVQGVALSQNLQQRQADAQRMYQMRLQQQQQQIVANNMAQRQQQAGGMNMLGSSGQQMNPAMAGAMRPNQGGMNMGNPPKQQEAAFLNNVQALMQAQGMPFNPQPMVYYKPKVRPLMDTHGGILVDGHGNVGEKLAKLKPDVPGVEEMGIIDMRAISLSLQSGLSREVRFALDILVRLSHDPRLHLELEKCEDLMDAIVDCAEEQVDALAEDAAEVSDILDLTSYEDAIRNSRSELESLQETPEYGTTAFELDRSADRLIAITTILRNLSFFESNHALLSSPNVIRFVSNTVRLLGTRIMLLRNNVNTVDFMKDTITFLSNTSDKIELPSREDAYNILCFLLAFAPTPAPNSTPTIRFTPYNPAVHRYLPPAIDCLAKLLARDDPNRAFYRQLFLADATSTPPYDLLTRSFGLAISVVPERGRGAEPRIAEARKPYLTQGMLAADILAGLCPGAESGVARSWLEAEDGWAKTLVWLSGILAMERQQAPPPPPGRGMQRPPLDQLDVGFGLITHRALAMLRKLGEKAQSEDEAREKRLSVDSLPKDEVLLGALCMQSMDGVALKKLCSFAELKG
ncbi:Arid bright domain protein [Neofusicoccum parvum]|uniref:Arid bright domain protein n=1 Tax=Neofusicoccum parvum TaxID=310453 RepID=A0ACB5SDK5_9PEZI|nr:Arid bright domain protein [Neofusicoccum parvum]GME35872.1 Arid bright domain protein [Neofusicoccum parvum]